MLILGVESSCDETGVALYDSVRGLLAHALYSAVVFSHSNLPVVGRWPTSRARRAARGAHCLCAWS